MRTYQILNSLKCKDTSILALSDPMRTYQPNFPQTFPRGKVLSKAEEGSPIITKLEEATQELLEKALDRGRS